MDFHIIDILVIISFLSMGLIIGLVQRRSVVSFKDFLTFKDISVATMVCTLTSASIGGGSTFGVSENIYIFGAVTIIRNLFVPFHWLISAYLIAPAIQKFKSCTTVTEIMHRLYGAPGMWITGICCIVEGIGSLILQSVTFGCIFHYFLGVDYIYGALIGYSIISTYYIFWRYEGYSYY